VPAYRKKIIRNAVVIKTSNQKAVFQIRMSLNADPDPDPGFHLNADPDPDSGFWTLKTEIIRKFLNILKICFPFLAF